MKLNLYILCLYLLFEFLFRDSAISDDSKLSNEEYIQIISGNVKVISEIFRNPKTYSSSKFEAAAHDIVLHSGSDLVNQFMRSEWHSNSRASPAIKLELDNFADLAQKLNEFASGLALSARRNPGKMSESMRMRPGEQTSGGILGLARPANSSLSPEHEFHLMLQICAPCHTQYRNGQ